MSVLTVSQKPELAKQPAIRSRVNRDRSLLTVPVRFRKRLVLHLRDKQPLLPA